MAVVANLTNPVITIASVDFTDQCTSATLTVGYDQLETTTFGASGRTYTKGLQTVEVTATLYKNLGAGSVEATLADIVGDDAVTIVLKQENTTVGSSNPEYTVTGAFLANFQSIGGTFGELETVQVTFTGGTWVRDVTP